MDGVKTPSAQGGALTAAVEFARREPGEVLALVLGLDSSCGTDLKMRFSLETRVGVATGLWAGSD